MLQKIGVTSVMLHEPPVLQKGQRIALQLMSSGQTTGGKGGRYYSSRRWKHRAMFGERLRSPGKTYEARRIGRDDLIPAHAIEHHHNDATHEAPFHNRLTPILSQRG